MRIRDVLAIDFVLLFAVLILTIFGILFIYSAGVYYGVETVSTEYQRQTLWAIGAIILTIALTVFDYRKLSEISLYFYIGIILVLAYTCIWGRNVNGARRLIGIGILGIQPSEFSKVIVIVLLARYLDVTKRSQKQLLRLLIACFIVFVPMALILRQPDLGTALVFFPILISMIFIAGFYLRYVVFLVFFVLLTVCLTLLPHWEVIILGSEQPIFRFFTNTRFMQISIGSFLGIFVFALLGYLLYKKWYFYWIAYSALLSIFSLAASFVAYKILRPYQISRLIIFLDPNVDPRGAGWHIIQSRTAIGSGGLFGKGYLKGTHSHYQYIPEQSTDFIFSIFSEEWGFIGGAAVFVLFFLVCFRLVQIMKSSSDTFGAYIVSGITAMFLFHFLVNIGMTMGIMPITGIPLFFMSYGGSALTSAMMGIGIASSIYIRRAEHLR